jgi:translation initiation factor 2 beta subunit (eIF-2beta)/eIF-5
MIKLYRSRISTDKHFHTAFVVCPECESHHFEILSKDENIIIKCKSCDYNLEFKKIGEIDE